MHQGMHLASLMQLQVLNAEGACFEARNNNSRLNFHLQILFGKIIQLKKMNWLLPHMPICVNLAIRRMGL